MACYKGRITRRKVNALERKVAELERRESQQNDKLIYEEEGLYYKRDNEILPVSHPDLSTQPSILPQRFGNLHIKEVLIANGREYEIPLDVMIIEAFSFNDKECVSAICRKSSSGWTITNSEGIIPEFTLIRYVGSDNSCYYYYDYDNVEDYGNTLTKGNIIFDDANVKVICVQNWDTDGDGELSYAEAAAVTDLRQVFKNNLTITSFDELQYFTGVTSIGNSTFSSCIGLTSATIPNSVIFIGSSAFSNCTNLTSVTIPNSVTNIGNQAFYSCHGLTSVTIPNSVTSIGDYAFQYCTNLTSVTIPNSVTSIGLGAFRNCSGLTSVHISDIAAWCNIAFGNFDANPLYNAHCLFLNEEEIKDLVIPNSVTSIRDNAFYGCSGLTSVTIPDSVTSIGNEAFDSCSGLTSVTIGNSVTSIGNNAFWSCRNLTSVTIGNSVTSIKYNAFARCSGLTSITIPNSVTLIGQGAFSNCTGLTSVTIPNSVTSIGSDAFNGCSGLTIIRSLSISAPVVETNTFKNVKSNGTLYVPVGSTGYDTWISYLNNWSIIEQNYE